MIKPKGENNATLDDSFIALSHAHRRRILTLLHDQNPREEVEFPVEELPDDADAFDHLDLDIRHRHLPKLADAGFISWDRERDVITKGPRFEMIAPVIELMVNHHDELPDGWP